MGTKNYSINRKLLLKKAGFTLVELLIVMAIMAFLTMVGYASYSSSQKKARDAVRKSDLDQIKKALAMYKNDYNAYPPSTGNGDNKIIACIGENLRTIDWGVSFNCGTMTYMRILPEDFDEDNPYQYLQVDDGEDFCLWATLEYQTDGQIAGSHTRCSTCVVGDNDYVVCGD